MRTGRVTASAIRDFAAMGTDGRKLSHDETTIATLAKSLLLAEEALATICRESNARRPWVETLGSARLVAERARKEIKKLRAENRHTQRSGSFHKDINEEARVAGDVVRRWYRGAIGWNELMITLENVFGEPPDKETR